MRHAPAITRSRNGGFRRCVAGLRRTRHGNLHRLPVEPLRRLPHRPARKGFARASFALAASANRASLGIAFRLRDVRLRLGKPRRPRAVGFGCWPPLFLRVQRRLPHGRAVIAALAAREQRQAQCQEDCSSKYCHNAMILDLLGERQSDRGKAVASATSGNKTSMPSGNTMHAAKGNGGTGKAGRPAFRFPRGKSLVGCGNLLFALGRLGGGGGH